MRTLHAFHDMHRNTIQSIPQNSTYTHRSMHIPPLLHRAKSLSSLPPELPCCACLRSLELSSSTQPKKSALKVKSLSESLGAPLRRPSASSSNKGVVGFDSVQLREYPYVLGCNPSVQSGYPLTLAWCPISDVTQSIDRFEEQHPPRRHEMKSMSETEREAFLREAGYTKEELEKVYEEVAAIQLSRTLNRRDHRRAPSKSRPRDPVTEKYLDDSRNKRRDMKRFFSM